MKDKSISQTQTDLNQLRIENEQLLAENQQLRQRVTSMKEVIDFAKPNSASDFSSVEHANNWYRVPFVETKAILLIVDPEQKVIIDANPAACQFYGYLYPELVGKSITEINTAPNEKLITALNQAVQGQRPLFLFNHRLADGTIRQVEVDSSPISINARTYLFSIIHDVTDRLQMETALRESEAKFKLLVESAVDGIVLMDDAGKLLLTNPRFCKMMDCRRDQVVQPQYFCEIFQLDQTSIIQEHIQEVKKHRKAKLTDITIFRSDTTSFEVDIQSFLLPGTNGEPDQIVTYLRDVTQERIDQRAIQQNEEHLRTISELISDEVFALTRSSTGEILIEWDTNTLQLREGLVTNADRKKAWQQLLSTDTQQKISSVIAQQFEQPSIETTDAVITTKSGDKRTLRVFTRSVVDATTGKVTKVVGAVKDITEQITC